MLDHINAVIFDMDGTLVDSMWVWTSIDKDYIEKYHLEVPENFHENMEGMSFTETAQYFLKTFPQLPHTLEEIKQEWYEMSFDKYTHDIHLKDGVLPLLQYLKAHNIKIGIATSNNRELVEASLTSMHVRDFFDAISTSCEVNAGKPCPDVYLNAASQLSVDPHTCLAFEDVPMGIMAGKNAGMKVCAVEDWFSKAQESKKRELADYYITSFNDVLNHNFEVL